MKLLLTLCLAAASMGAQPVQDSHIPMAGQIWTISDPNWTHSEFADQKCAVITPATNGLVAFRDAYGKEWNLGWTESEWRWQWHWLSDPTNARSTAIGFEWPPGFTNVAMIGYDLFRTNAPENNTIYIGSNWIWETIRLQQPDGSWNIYRLKDSKLELEGKHVPYVTNLYAIGEWDLSHSNQQHLDRFFPPLTTSWQYDEYRENANPANAGYDYAEWARVFLSRLSTNSTELGFTSDHRVIWRVPPEAEK